MSHLYSPSQEAPPVAVFGSQSHSTTNGSGCPQQAQWAPSGVPVSSPLDPSALLLRGADLWGAAVRFESQGKVPEN